MGDLSISADCSSRLESWLSNFSVRLFSVTVRYKLVGGSEVIAHLTGQMGAEVTVTIEIEARLPNGARSVKNEAMLLRRGFISRIHRKKPKGKTMPERTRLMRRSRRFAAPSCVCASEGSAQSDNPHDRPCASPREDRARQPCLQHAALHLAADKIRACLRAQALRNRLRDNPLHQRPHLSANLNPITCEPTRIAVIGAVQLLKVHRHQ